jgi:prepilin-type N-terminal cleavage/methylation domain-containing protein
MLPPDLLRQPLASTGTKKGSAFMRGFFRHDRRAFTLVEMLVSIAALTLFVLMVTRLVNSASTITTIGNKHMGADSQARSVLDRMAVDFAQMVKRSDVDFFGKNTLAPNSVGGAMRGGPTGIPGVNDQIAFFGAVPGYYPPTGAQSPISLVAYRINANNQLERMGKGLMWNGVSSTYTPMVFLNSSNSTIATTWPAATTNATDPAGNYEVIGPYVFRFEYYYLIKGQTVGGITYLSILSDTPWDKRITGHTSVSAFQDVSAIGVTIAVIDPQSRVLVPNTQPGNTQLATLAGQMSDFSLTMHPLSAGAPCGALGGTTQPGDLDAQWQCAVNATTDPLPRAAASAIHIYSRLFPIVH